MTLESSRPNTGKRPKESSVLLYSRRIAHDVENSPPSSVQTKAASHADSSTRAKPKQHSSSTSHSLAEQSLNGERTSSSSSASPFPFLVPGRPPASRESGKVSAGGKKTAVAAAAAAASRPLLDALNEGRLSVGGQTAGRASSEAALRQLIQPAVENQRSTRDDFSRETNRKNPLIEPPRASSSAIQHRPLPQSSCQEQQQQQQQQRKRSASPPSSKKNNKKRKSRFPGPAGHLGAADADDDEEERDDEENAQGIYDFS